MRTIGLASCITAAALAVSVLASRDAVASEPWQNDYIIFGRGTSLWRTDPRGKANAQVVASLPEGRVATDVAALKTDAAGRVLLAEIGSKWYWLALDASQPNFRPLACGAGTAELAPQANYVVCAGAKRGTAIIRLADGVITTREVPTQGARLAMEGSSLDLIWADKNGIWRAPLAKPKQIIKVAADAPSHHLSISPDGSRAVGFFENPPHGHVLFGFALDGIAARRKGIKAGIPLSWSHDGMWILVQDGTSACLMRTLGGQYKCWKGFVAGAAAPDGHWQLMFGNEPAPSTKPTKGSSRAKATTKGKGKDKAKKTVATKGKGGSGNAPLPSNSLPPVSTETPAEPPTQLAPALPDDAAEDGQDESGDDEPEADRQSIDGGLAAAPTAPLGKGPHNLYRGQLEGAFTDRPVLVVHDVAGAVVWVPMRTPPITSALPAPTLNAPRMPATAATVSAPTSAVATPNAPTVRPNAAADAGAGSGSTAGAGAAIEPALAPAPPGPAAPPAKPLAKPPAKPNAAPPLRR